MTDHPGAYISDRVDKIIFHQPSIRADSKRHNTTGSKTYPEFYGGITGTHNTHILFDIEPTAFLKK
jgi:hypothetical protein